MADDNAAATSPPDQTLAAKPLPSADEFFGGAPTAQPTAPSADSNGPQPLPGADEFFAQPIPQEKPDFLAGLGHTLMQPTLSAGQRIVAGGHILNAFTDSAKEAFGSPESGFEPEVVKSLKDWGVFPDMAKKQDNMVQDLMEIMLRPAIMAADVTARGAGALYAGYQGAAVTAGQEMGAPALGRDVALLPEAFMMGVHGTLGIPHPPLPAHIAEARASAVIGEGEGGYFGTKQPTINQLTARIEAAAQMPAEPEAAASTPAPDIHEIAKGINPEIMAKRDTLEARTDQLRTQIQEAAAARDQAAAESVPHSEEDIAALRAKIEGANARKTKIYQSQLDDMLAANDKHLEEAKASDSEAMAALRKQLQETDYARRDIAPEVSETYRQAQEQMPPAEETPAEEESAAPTAAGEQPPPKSPWERPEAEAPAPLPVSTKIRSDVIQKLTDAGRPTEEASAAAELIAQHYEARAERFAGKRGTADEMYERDGANIKAGKEKARELVQPENGRTLAQSANPEKDMADLERALDKATPEARAVIEKKMDELAAQAAAKAKPTPPGVYADIEAKVAKMRPEFREQRLKSLNKKLDAGIATPKEMAEREMLSGGVKELEQKSRGKIKLATEEAKATITLMKSADASTFIHETGHHWLDELMRDAQDEHAPESLKKDAETVRRWLGNEGGEIETRQHEKFARGFERYLMEGTAPSKALAHVFAKFKDWLTKIYRTVDKLKSPISDDIRDVFDRLLAAKPEKTTIAPDRQHLPGEAAANLHEVDARTTPPAQADAVGTTVESDIDKTAKLHDPEVYDAIKAAETSNVPATAASDTGLAEPAEPTGEGNASAQPGAVTESGGNATAVGAGAREQPAEQSAGGGAGTGGGGAARKGENDSAGANTRLGKPDSGLVDKAGNIRLDNLNTPEDVNEVIRQTADENNAFMDARRNVISDGQVLDLADALGMDPALLNTRKLGQAFNAEQIVAARKLLVQSATEVRDAMAKAAVGGDKDVIAYAEAKTRHQMIQEQVSGITAEAGRALRAFRAMEGGAEAKSLGEFLKQQTGKTLFQLQEEAKLGASLNTPERISKFVNDSKTQTVRNMILEYYINALISGPITHMRYSMGNALNALWTPLVEIPTAAVIGKIREAYSGEVADRVYLGEAGAQLHAMVRGSQEGLRAAAEAFRTNISPRLPGERASAQMLDNAQLGHAIPGKVGEIINLPSKSVSAIHSFFKSLRYEQNIQGLAYRTAMKEGLTEGSDAFANRIADIVRAPTKEMMESASANALKELYMAPTDYHSAMGALNRVTNKSLLAKIIVPFMKIGTQITRNAFIERTPLGFASKEVRANLLYQEGGAAGDFQAAKVTTGLALIGTMAAMTAEGKCTGDGPEDPAQRSIWLLNHRPNSCQVGDVTIPYQGLGHLGMLMRFSANMTESAQGWGAEDGDKLAKSFLKGMTKSVLDENFMRGVKDMLDAVYHPDEYAGSYLKGFATNWLPFSIGLSQVARKIDPDMREAQTIMQAAKAKIPFVSETLQPKRDRFGEVIPNGAPLPNYKNDPVVQRMEALQMGIGKLERKIRGVPLSDQQYDTYAQMAGRITKLRLNSLIATSGFSNLPETVQVETIHKVISDSREMARSVILMHNPDIYRQAVAAKRNALKK